MRYRLDPTWQRGDGGRAVLAGSPLRLFRLTEAGRRIVDRIESRVDVARSTLTERLLDAGAIHPIPERGDANRFDTADVTIVTPQFGGDRVPADRLVVDDGSVPPIVGAACRLDVNRGPAAARNRGRDLVTTPLIAFVDADVDLDEAWLEPLLAHFDDERVGLVAPRVSGDHNASLDMGPTPARIRAGSRVSYAPAAAIVVRVTAFDDVGGFDEQLRFGEDVDFVWRLDEAGWRCRYEPEGTVRHRPRPSWWSRLHQQAGYGSSAAPLALRHPRSLTPFRANGWSVGALLLLVLGRPVSAVGLALGSAAALAPRLRTLPAATAFAIALDGHAQATRQCARAMRRVWWPIVAVAGLRSTRVRRIALAALLADPRAAVSDVAYGWGVWTAMGRHRTLRPIVPTISSWPSTRGRSARAGRAQDQPPMARYTRSSGPRP